MQYPTLPLRPLRETLRFREDVVYVDNERNFRRALAARPYEALFSDRFADGFGHLTVEGNRLLAASLLAALEPLLPPVPDPPR
jgi:hypothetical protein